MSGLKSLAGSKAVEQDDFQSGTGTYIVRFGEFPKVKMADLTKAVGRYKIGQVKLKVTSKVTEKDGKFYAGSILLANSKEEGAQDLLSGLKGKSGVFVLYGILSEDAKGGQTLTLQQVTEAKE
ncbi:MAG: hypothetical protein ACK44W_05490 [Planctomycetota bacterium]